MSTPNRPKSSQQGGAAAARRKGQPQKRQAPKVPDLWRTPSPLPEAEPIEMPTEVGSLLQSLGDPPTHNGASAALYFNTSPSCGFEIDTLCNSSNSNPLITRTKITPFCDCERTHTPIDTR